ncbi:hypothetical protein ABIB82_002508 [Bradyrhizobium sp. i1.8.4]|uniref:hypothetical protein n=1 Tax=unclassified Bradyrhizobium TaxID=2631580 RepID=UPI003D25CFF7
MTQADSVHSTPPANTSAIDQAPPTDTSRRRFISQAAGVAAGGAILALATASATADAAEPVAALARPEADPVFEVIARHRAEQQAYSDALVARDELGQIVPEEFQRPSGRVQWGMKAGKPHYLHSHEAIDDCLVAGDRHSPEIKARLHAELDRDRTELFATLEEIGVTDAEERVEQLCDLCWELGWTLANTMPTSLAGVAALLKYANEFEDNGDEWPCTDAIGPDGWHYQLRQTAARAVEALQPGGMV